MENFFTPKSERLADVQRHPRKTDGDSPVNIGPGGSSANCCTGAGKQAGVCKGFLSCFSHSTFSAFVFPSFISYCNLKAVALMQMIFAF